MRRRLVTALVSVLGVGCASSQGRMQRALEPSMERVIEMETYLATVAGISAYPERMTRGDGFVYLSDVAPVMRYFAEREDRARYVALRRFVLERMMWRDAAGLVLARRFRRDESLERATPYGYLWTQKALLEGWRYLSDTASAEALAQIVPLPAGRAANPSAMYALSTDCADAMDVVRTDPAPGRAVLARARSLVGSRQALREQAALGVVASEGEVDMLSCLARLGLALDDPDATVRYLDRMLDILQPFLVHSGRTDVGTGADILLTLHRAREAGPAWSAPHPVAK